MLPLQLPGAPELVVLLLVVALLAAPVVLLTLVSVAVYVLFVREDSPDDGEQVDGSAEDPDESFE